MRRPSILFINRVYPPVRGATGRVLRDLARSFAREGWQVTVITTGPKPAKERDGGVRIIRLRGPEKPGNIFVYAWIWLKMMVVALRHPKTHLLVTMTDPPLLVIAGQIIKKFKGARHIHWCHDLYPHILPALGVKVPGPVLAYVQRMTRSAMARADNIIVVGRCMAGRLVYEGIDQRHITMIPNWPDMELAQAGDRGSAANTAAAHHAPPVKGSKPYEEIIKDGPKFRVLYAGNIGLAHPIETILGAAEILNAQHPEIEFVFVGDGPRFDEIAKERSRRALDNIRLMPYQPPARLRALMESGDVHLISVRDEAAGMLVPVKLYAALAVQRPCIFVGPAQSEAAKVIGDFKAGAVVAQGQPEELAAQIRHFRMSGDDWFAAHHGAAAASNIYAPKDTIEAWIQRAWAVVEQDIKPEPGAARVAA